MKASLRSNFLGYFLYDGPVHDVDEPVDDLLFFYRNHGLHVGLAFREEVVRGAAELRKLLVLLLFVVRYVPLAAGPGHLQIAVSHAERRKEVVVAGKHRPDVGMRLDDA